MTNTTFNTQPSQPMLPGSLRAAHAQPVTETYPSLSWDVSSVLPSGNAAEIRFVGCGSANLDNKQHTPGGREVSTLT